MLLMFSFARAALADLVTADLAVRTADGYRACRRRTTLPDSSGGGNGGA